MYSYAVKPTESEGDHLNFSGLNSSETGFGEKVKECNIESNSIN